MSSYLYYRRDQKNNYALVMTGYAMNTFVVLQLNEALVLLLIEQVIKR